MKKTGVRLIISTVNVAHARMKLAWNVGVPIPTSSKISIFSERSSSGQGKFFMYQQKYRSIALAEASIRQTFESPSEVPCLYPGNVAMFVSSYIITSITILNHIL